MLTAVGRMTRMKNKWFMMIAIEENDIELQDTGAVTSSLCYCQ